MSQMQRLSKAGVVQVPIGQIGVGARRRDKPGRIRALAISINAHGLIHPILLDGETLVAGGRRLEACRLLNWTTIPARQVERLSEEERRAIELEENTAREPLSDYAMSKARLAQIRQAEADLKAKAQEVLYLHGTKPPASKKGGRPKKPASLRAVSSETGISIAEQVRIERHVALAERYPFLQRDGWVKHVVLTAGDALERIPEEDRSAIAVMLDQPALPPPTVISMLVRAAEMTKAERRAVIQQAASPDEFVRQTAGTTLARVPPEPDPGLLALGAAVEDYKKAVAHCRSARFKPRLIDLSNQTAALRDEFRAHEREERARVQTH